MNRRSSVDRPVGLTLLLGLVGVLLTTGLALADIGVEIVPNQAYHEDGDELWIRVDLENDAGSTTVDFYLALGCQGFYYFHPGYGQEVEFERLELAAGEKRSILVIPSVNLPEGLPLLEVDVYAVCCQPGTYELASTVGYRMLQLQDRWPILPAPDHGNTFTLTVEDSSVRLRSDQAAFDAVASELKTRFPETGLYARLGVAVFNGLSDVIQEIPLEEAAGKARAAGLCLGAHARGTNHHAGGDLQIVRELDRRNTQWDSDGSVAPPGSSGDDATLTPSRMAPAVMTVREEMARMAGEAFARAETAYPGTMAWSSGPIEVELWHSSQEEPHYADYSPFAIAEFRDWLRHAGIYHDQTGAFAGQGVDPSFLDGHDFSEDPTPDIHPGPGPTFNQLFGTDFTTWELRYWDPVLLPEPLPYGADPLPELGETGHAAGGFDAPREIDRGVLTTGNQLFQDSWCSYESAEPFHGFRQVMVWHYVQDSLSWLNQHGVPADRNFCHQIPTDFLNHWIRNESSASPIWTAFTDQGRTGLTAFFDTTVDPGMFQVLEQYAPGFGFFEYHPDPFMELDRSHFDQALDLAFQSRCSSIHLLYLFAGQNGWWPMADTIFEDALRDFFQAPWDGVERRRFDQPYSNRQWVDYLPPAVRQVEQQADRITWAPEIWAGQPDLTWADWGEFDHFEIHRSTQPGFVPNPDTLLASTTSTEWFGTATGSIQVIAVSNRGLTSPVP